MKISNVIQFNGAKVGSTLCRKESDGTLTVFGTVVEITTNSRGGKVAVLDRTFTVNGRDYTNRITDRYIRCHRIRRIEVAQ